MILVLGCLPLLVIICRQFAVKVGQPWHQHVVAGFSPRSVQDRLIPNSKLNAG